MKKRLPWLIVLLFLGMAVSSVVGMFESVVAVLPVVICFQSLVLDMAGNVGTQSLAVTIRVLMDENLTVTRAAGPAGQGDAGRPAQRRVPGLMALAFLGGYIHVCKRYAWLAGVPDLGLRGHLAGSGDGDLQHGRHAHPHAVSPASTSTRPWPPAR